MTTSNGAHAEDEGEKTSVINRPDSPTGRGIPTLDQGQLLWLNLGASADEIPVWGRNYKLRDAELRNFITSENMFASALSIVASRNASFSWNITGGERTAERMQDILENANGGLGWHHLIIQTSLDLYTQDSGAFWEIDRYGNTPSSPIREINHLDAARCYHTGNREKPVIYIDRLSRQHELPWYNVITFAEMPVPVEGLYGLQYCALTRLIKAIQVRKNIIQREYEKTAGRNTKAIQLVKGITTQQLNDAISQANITADAAGLTRWMNPIIVGTLDPKADVGHDTIEIASMPDDYDAEVFYKQYIGQIAMAFLSDYQEFGPLPGGNLGTSTQSQILHLKNHGKGPGLFRRLIEHSVNTRIMPRNCRMNFMDPDFEAEKTEAEVKKLRAETRAIRIKSFEITPQAARQIANDEGDLPQDIMAMIGEQDVTEDVVVDNVGSAASQLGGEAEVVQVGQGATGA